MLHEMDHALNELSVNGLSCAFLFPFCFHLMTHPLLFVTVRGPVQSDFTFSLTFPQLPLFPHYMSSFPHHSLSGPLLSLKKKMYFPSQLSSTTLSPFSSHRYFLLLLLPLLEIRLRVRAEYLEHDSALRQGVSSDKRQPLERQFELFSKASSLLRARDLGSIVCDINFTELDNLEAFWADYLSGALLEALKGVFITDSLRMAAGAEGVRLLISVDQDDYEEGRWLLRARRMLTSSHGGRTEADRAV